MNLDYLAQQRQSIKQQGFYRDEYVVRDKYGKEITILASINSIEIGDKVTGYVAVHHDITLRKKLEAQLRIFNRDLSRMVEEKTSEIKKSYDAIRELVSHLQAIREEERLKMAQEIHDELGQQLTIMKMDVSWLDKKIPEQHLEWKEKTQALKNTLDGTIKTVRRLASELRPSVLDDMGLPVAIEWQAREIEKRSGIKISFHCDEKELELNDQLKISLFRVVQESLTNVVRYAQAKNVHIRLEVNKNNLTLTIDDDGIGFDPASIALKKTLGILGMKERVVTLGGHLSLVTSPGNGTTIRVTIPYKST
jgi:signal transduction histidine kinase